MKRLLPWFFLMACKHTPPHQAAPVAALDPLATPPPIPASPDWTPPVPELAHLGDHSGPAVWLIHNDKLPLVSVRLVVLGGSATDPADHPGEAALADTMLLHGAGDRNAEAFAEITERLAIDIDVSTGRTATVVSMDAQADQLTEGLLLLADVVMRPRFDADEVDRVKTITIANIAEALDDPRTVASDMATFEYFGPDHPLAHPARGTRAGIAELSAQDLRRSWRNRFGRDRATFVVAGDVDQATLMDALSKHFVDWGEAAAPLPELPPARTVKDAKGGLYLVDNPDASQSVLHLEMPGWTATDAALPAARMGVIALGGTFTSRLNRLLREEKGYTYGASAWLDPSADHGEVIASTAVRADVTGPALTDLLTEIDQTRKEGVAPDEIAKALGARRTQLVEAMQSQSGTARLYAGLVLQQLPPAGLRDELTRAARTDPTAVGAALAQLAPQRGVIVVVGDLSKVKKAVEAAVPGDWQTVTHPDAKGTDAGR